MAINDIKVPKRFVRRYSFSIFFLVCLFPILFVYAQQHPKLESAMRVTGTIVDGKITSIATTPLHVALPLTVREKVLRQNEYPMDYFIEILDHDKNVVLRSRINDPTFVLMEYEDPNKPGHIISKEIHLSDTTFTFIIPAPPKAKAIHFKRIQPGQEALPAKQRKYLDLGVFEITTQKKPASEKSNGGSS